MTERLPRGIALSCNRLPCNCARTACAGGVMVVPMKSPCAGDGSAGDGVETSRTGRMGTPPYQSSLWGTRSGSAQAECGSPYFQIRKQREGVGSPDKPYPLEESQSGGRNLFWWIFLSRSVPVLSLLSNLGVGGTERLHRRENAGRKSSSSGHLPAGLPGTACKGVGNLANNPVLGGTGFYC